MRTLTTVPSISTVRLGPITHNLVDIKENAPTPSCTPLRLQNARTLNKSSAEPDLNQERHVRFIILFYGVYVCLIGNLGVLGFIQRIKHGIKLRIRNCLRKSEVTVERFSICIVIEKLMEHGIHCLPCSYTYDAIDLLP